MCSSTGTPKPASPGPSPQSWTLDLLTDCCNHYKALYLSTPDLVEFNGVTGTELAARMDQLSAVASELSARGHFDAKSLSLRAS